MASKTYTSVSGPSLVSVKVYLRPGQQQYLRVQAARRGVSMSEFIKQLIDRDLRGLKEMD